MVGQPDFKFVIGDPRMNICNSWRLYKPHRDFACGRELCGLERSSTVSCWPGPASCDWHSSTMSGPVKALSVETVFGVTSIESRFAPVMRYDVLETDHLDQVAAFVPRGFSTWPGVLKIE